MERTKVELGDSVALTIETNNAADHVCYLLEAGGLTIGWSLPAAAARRVANDTLLAANGRDPETPRERR